jgi:cell division protein FtsA
VDISASKIAAVAAKVNKNNIAEIFFEDAPSSGMKRGVIVDAIELSASVEKVLKKLKSKSGLNIKYIYTSMSGQDIITRHSRAIIPLAERGNKVITASDIEEVNRQARILGSSLEEEIITQVPLNYTIDSQTGIANPLGLYSHRIEVDLYLVCAKLSSLQTLIRMINQSGFEAKEVFFSPFATYEAVSLEHPKEGVNVLCDIGKDSTEILIFEADTFKEALILPLGGDNLTEALSEELKITFEMAEEVKKSYGRIQDIVGPERDKEILIKKDSIYKPIKESVVINVVTKEAKLMAQRIKDKVAEVVSIRQISNFLVCGRSVLLEGFLEVIEANLGVPVSLGRITNPRIAALVHNHEIISAGKSLAYLTACGIFCKAMSLEQPRFTVNPNSSHNPAFKVMDKLKSLYHEYF